MGSETEEDSLSQLPEECPDSDASQSSQPKPGEKGWLVALAEKSSDSALAASRYQQDRRRSLTSSQERVFKVSSQEQNRRASSSDFQTFGSQEILSQPSDSERNSQSNNGKPSGTSTLGIMSVPETESIVPDPPAPGNSGTERQDSQKVEAKSSSAPDTLAQECSDIIKKLKPSAKKSIDGIDLNKGSPKMKVPKFKAAPKKKPGVTPPNVNEMLANLKPVEVDTAAATTSVPMPTPTKQTKPRVKKPKTPAKKSEHDTTKNKTSSVPKKPSFGQHKVTSLPGKSAQSFEDIFDNLITQSISTSESRSQLDLSAVPSPSSNHADESKTKAPRKRKIAKKPKGGKNTAKPTSTKRKLNLKERQSKPPTKKAKTVNCAETKSALLKLQEMRTCGTWAQCTIISCGKWRHLETKDPAEVKEFFICQDNPDSRYNSCQAPEQLWSSELSCRMVETRFSVGSLVWAKMAGYPAWPAMVDDDPDTGSFFWTEMVEDKWVEKPNSYHVIFFDTEVSRAWVSNSSIRKFDGVRPVINKTALGSRLAKAFEEAVSASEQRITLRRRQHCLAARYKGPWGPVWPGYGEEESGLGDGADTLNMEQISQEIRSQPREQRDMSFIDKSFNCDVLDTVDSVFNNNDTSLDTANNNSESLPPVVANKSKPSKSPEKTSSPAKKAKTPKKSSVNKVKDKENVPPVSTVAHLYQDKDVYTAEMTEKVAEEPRAGLSVSFQDNDDILNSSLAREVDSAIQLTNLFTPVKRINLDLVDKAGVSPGGPLTSSTPVRQVKPVLDCGDGGMDVVDNKDKAEEEEDNLDHSTAFSEDGH